MKLFIITNVLVDYTDYINGMVVIKAESLTQAREYFFNKYEDDCIDFDQAIKDHHYNEFELVDTDTKAPGIVTAMDARR
jgi:hypothetical protein